MIIAILSLGLISPWGNSDPLASLRRAGSFPGQIVTNKRDGSAFVWVPSGNFLFGPDNQSRWLPGFWIGQDCVSRDQFEKFCSRTGYVRDKERINRHLHQAFIPYKGGPVIENDVDYHDALAYAKWAGCTIPSAQMWEKTARGTDGRIYPWGNQERGRPVKADEHAIPGPRPGQRFLTEVPEEDLLGQYPQEASPYGCLDMMRFWRQWTSTGFKGQAVKDRMAQMHGKVVQIQVLKGAAYYNPLLQCSSSDQLEAYIADDSAFRLCFVPPVR